MKDMQRVAFGRHLRRMRERSGLSTYQLATMADIKQITLEHVEQGSFNFPFDIISRLAVCLSGEIRIVINNDNNE